jgi:G:T/U-mismatch repair DNA glycosylase
MDYITKNTFAQEIHPWQPFVPKMADKLILGTFPTHERNRGTYKFYYLNPNNEFWKILLEIAGLKSEDSQQMDPIKLRKQVLTKRGLGIADIYTVIYRQKTSSNDNALFPN